MELTELDFAIIPPSYVNLVVGKRQPGKSTLIITHMQQILNTRSIHKTYVFSRKSQYSNEYSDILNPTKSDIYTSVDKNTLRFIMDDQYELVKKNKDIESIIVFDDINCCHVKELLLDLFINSFHRHFTVFMAIQSLCMITVDLFVNTDLFFHGKEIIRSFIKRIWIKMGEPTNFDDFVLLFDKMKHGDFIVKCNKHHPNSKYYQKIYYHNAATFFVNTPRTILVD